MVYSKSKFSKRHRGFLLAVFVSILFENITQLDGKGPMARHALQLHEFIFPQSSEPGNQSNDSLANNEPDDMIYIDDPGTQSAALPEPGTSQATTGKEGHEFHMKWWKSSYFDTVPREERLLCPASGEVSVWNGRLGNHIHQILNLLLFAHLCHLSEVRFPKHQGNMHAYSHQIGLLDMPTKLSFPQQDSKLKHLLKCPRHAKHKHAWFGNFCLLAAHQIHFDRILEVRFARFSKYGHVGEIRCNKNAYVGISPACSWVCPAIPWWTNPAVLAETGGPASLFNTLVLVLTRKDWMLIGCACGFWNDNSEDKFFAFPVLLDIFRRILDCRVHALQRRSRAKIDALSLYKFECNVM